MSPAPQESRTERATIPMTPSEKNALRFISAMRNVPESDLLREALIEHWVAEAARLQKRLEEVA